MLARDGLPDYFTPDGVRFITRESGNNLRLWEFPSGKFLYEFEGTQGDTGVAFAPSAPMFASYSLPSNLSKGSSLIIWNSVTGEKVWPNKSGKEYEFVTYTGNGKHLVGFVNTYGIVGAERYYMIAELGTDGRPKEQRIVKFDELDYKLLFDATPRLNLGDVSLRETLAQVLTKKFLEAKNGFINKLWPNQKGSLVIGTSSPYESQGPPVTVFSLSPLAYLGPLEGWDDGDVISADVSSDDSSFALLSQKCTPERCEPRQMSVWSAGDRRRLWTLQGGFDNFMFSPDGTRLILLKNSEPAVKNNVRVEDKDVWVYDTRTGRQISHLVHDNRNQISSAASASEILGVIYSDESAKWLVTRTEHTVYVWNGETGRLLQKENLFEDDDKTLDADLELVRGSATLEELNKVAKRRLNKCPGMNQ